jgi:pyruvate formate lyase activating enzyme
MRIVGLIKTSLLDWDGKVTSVIYLAGCNFRCPFCHNADLVLRPAEMPEVDMDALEEYLQEQADFLDGVVVTGGEPTLNEDLPQLIKWLRDKGLKVKLDTNGTNPDMLEDLLDAGMLDYVAMDIKAPLDESYNDLSGVDAPLEQLKRSISIIMDSGVDYEFRTTVVPILLKEEDIERIAAFIGGARRYALQQFRPGVTLDEKFSVLDPYPAARIRDMAERAGRYVRNVVIRGDV